MAKPPIKDEFTDLPISRQRKYQLRMERDGRCVQCGKPTEAGLHCLEHMIAGRERSRVSRKSVKRHSNSLSYRLQKAATARRKNGKRK